MFRALVIDSHPTDERKQEEIMSDRYTFKAEESALTRRMAEGHLIRKGHELKGIWVYTMPGFRTLQRTCCK